MRLGLVGFVRNMRDGRVEIEVSGPAEAVEELVQQAREGPTFSHVTNVVRDSGTSDKAYDSFEIQI